MKKGTNIGIKDCNGKPLHIGDYHLHTWGWFMWKGNTKSYQQVQQLTWDKKGKKVLLGNDCHNLWEGKEVKKISKKDFKELGVPLGRDFFIEDGEVILLTDGHCFGNSPEGKEKFDKFNRTMMDHLDRMMFLGENYKPD